VSIDVLGFVLERVSGKRLDALLDEMIFKPLKMKDTRFQVTADLRDRFADAFDTDPLKAPLWKWIRVDVDRGDAYFNGGGGLVSTAHDYHRFAQMIVNAGQIDGVRLLSPKSVRFMLSDHIAGLHGSPAFSTGPGYGFGLGFAVRLQDGLAVTAGSEGDATWSGFAGTSFLIDPKEKLVAIFMAQGPATRNETRYLFKNVIYGALVN
jgi:CubicO group peptidase (beta-lactamase class C family)